MAKNKKNDNNKLKYANPKYLINELNKIGITKPFKTIFSYYAVFLGLLFLVSYLLKLRLPYVSMIFLVEIFIVPLCIKCHYQKTYENKRFSEVNQYIEQMLYSFKETKKVLKSLSDIKPMFQNTEIGDAIDAMMVDIEKETLDVALKNFEAKYNCQKIHQLHKFLYEVETLGGRHQKTINLLLEDRESWETRTLLFQKEKKNKKALSIVSIIVSLIFVIAMERALPANIDISENILCQISSTFTIILDLILYYVVENKCSQSILSGLKERKDKDIKRNYEYLENFDARREFVRGLKVMVIPIAIIVLGIIQNIIPIVVTGMVMSVWFLFQYKIIYHTKLKAIKEEISIQFPRWLMQMALLTQSNSVQVALYKSIPEAPTVLKPELIKLNNALGDNPISVEPYLNFMKDFNLPEITSSVKMFYAISSGAGSDAERQIEDIIKKNNAMIDKAEKLNFENALGGMYALFLTPQLISGLKLIVDMIIFFMYMMSMTNSVAV